MDLLRTILIGCLTIAIVPNICHADLSKAEKASISLGIDAGEKATKLISEFGDKESKAMDMFKRIGKLTSFLGATGGLVSFVLSFLPSRDSKELAYMKRKFKQVNLKLDIITAKLDNVKSLITYENQRAIYVRSATKIEFGHKQLLNALDELQKVKCTSKSLCKRKKSRIASNYVKYFAVKYNMHEILNGVSRKTSVFGDPLLSVVQKHFRCSIQKIDQFANSVLKLAFKAQQVILAHEKLLGSKQSITQSMNEWLSLIYKVRKHQNKVSNYCYKNIHKYMVADLLNKKFQRVTSNGKINTEIKKLFDKRYSWLGFTVYSYNAWGATEHEWKNNHDTTIWYSPGSKKERKRNIFVSFVDKKGAYTNPRNSVLFALDHIATTFYFYKSKYKYVRDILDVFIRKLKERGVWKYISHINMRKNEDNFMIRTDNTASYIRKIYHLKFYKTEGATQSRSMAGYGHKILLRKIYVVVNLKSMGQVYRHCHLKCKSKGLCKIKPYSSQQYCECKPYYQGAKCEEYSKALLAKTIDSMLAVTLKLPHLSDISFDIKDLREFIGVSFVRLQSAISSLDGSFEKKLHQLSRKVEWASLITQYSDTIKGIKYFAHAFELLNHYNKTTGEFKKRGKELAHQAIDHRAGIQKYLFNLNKMMIGVNGSLLGHQPFLLVFMESKAGKPCTPAYKRAVDNCWRQLILLQQVGYFVWSQALAFAGRPTKIVDYLYKKRAKRQLSIIKKATCQYKVKRSTNIQCTGGFYLNPSMKIRNTCQRNYYVIGSLITSCKRKVSTCKRCGCNIVGSRSQQCSDIHGKCQCKKSYYGKKCTSRDCVWKNWSNFGPCVGCGYSAKKKRSRSVQTPKQGNGKACPGSSDTLKDCFKGCCKNHLHCSNTKKCIHKSLWCNYVNDCGDKQDEFHCKEKCRIRLGNRIPSKIIRGALAVCDRGEAMNGFRLVWAWRDVRWSVTCCKLFASKLFSNRYRSSHLFSSKRVYHMSKQPVDCGRHSFLRAFAIHSRGSSAYFLYFCSDMSEIIHRKRTYCIWKHTAWGKDGDGKKAYRLTSQIFKCPPRYFINYFRMISKPTGSWTIAEGKWRFHYRCCRIIP